MMLFSNEAPSPAILLVIAAGREGGILQILAERVWSSAMLWLAPWREMKREILIIILLG